MESATATRTAPRPPPTTEPRGEGAELRGPPPHGRLGHPDASRSTRPSGSPRSSPAFARRSPSGRRSASPAGAAGSSACATGSSTTRTSSTTACRRRAARSAPTPRSRRSTCSTRSTSGAIAARASSPTRPSPRTCRCSATGERRSSTGPIPVAGIISPWNFPLILSLGDGDPGAGRRLRAGHQAVGVHPADADGAGAGLEGGPRRAPTCSTSSTAWARRAVRSSTGATSSSSPARSGPGRSS